MTVRIAQPAPQKTDHDEYGGMASWGNVQSADARSRMRIRTIIAGRLRKRWTIISEDGAVNDLEADDKTITAFVNDRGELCYLA